MKSSQGDFQFFSLREIAVCHLVKETPHHDEEATALIRLGFLREQIEDIWFSGLPAASCSRGEWVKKLCCLMPQAFEWCYRSTLNLFRWNYILRKNWHILLIKEKLNDWATVTWKTSTSDSKWAQQCGRGQAFLRGSIAGRSPSVFDNGNAVIPRRIRDCDCEFAERTTHKGLQKGSG